VIVLRQRSSLLFALILLLSIALVVWWTTFQVAASSELAAAGQALAAGDADGAAKALGASDARSLAELATARRTMFASEGAFLLLVLLGLGWLFVASVRREHEARSAQDRFLAGATHELKTPLAAIVLLLESLRDDRVPPEKRQQWLAHGLREAERLSRGLDNVLTAAGLRTARRRPDPQPGDLVDDLREAVEAMRGRGLLSGVVLAVDSPKRLPIRRDGPALQLVLRNLLDNAIKFSPADSAVHVSLRADGGTAVLAVRDAGRGMAADELARAFEPFWRAGDAAAGGTGLGLHLVRELVHAHGGTVEVRSAGRDQGCEFIVRLPLSGAAP
jgi:signal transduction histidine kinase